MSVLNIPDVTRLECWIGTYTGKHFHPFRPRAGDIDLKDIAHGLALSKWACRFRGQCKHHYTVAQHSVEVSKVIRSNGGSERAALAGLLHDASEAYLPDLAAPIKEWLPDYRELESTIQTAIEVYFLGSELDPDERKTVKEADMIMLATEAYSLMPAPTDWGSIRGIIPIENWRGPIPASKAETEFLEMFNELQDWGLNRW
jgi:hypothetical protein